MIHRVIRRFGTAAFVAFLVSPAHGSAQTVGASLQGIVADPSGAALPNAEVTVINTTPGAVWELKTDSTGHYRVPVLRPGEYEVHLTLTGFQAVTRRGILLAVGQNAVVDVRMELGTIGEEL